jgi:LAO/AO transport system kinase
MVHMDDGHVSGTAGHHGMGVDTDVDMPDKRDDAAAAPEPWETPVLETVATTGEGVDEFLDTLQAHADWLAETGQIDAKRRQRTAEEIRTLLREDAGELVEGELAAHGGVDALTDRVLDGKTDPYSIANEVLDPVEACLDAER